MGPFSRKAASAGFANAIGRTRDDDDTALKTKRKGVGWDHGVTSLG
jgi:hypothetical protein